MPARLNAALDPVGNAIHGGIDRRERVTVAESSRLSESTF
jgi:hypothetical protein